MTEANLKETYALDTEEMSFVDLAYQWLAETKEPKKFHDLVQHVAQIKGYPKESIEQLLAMFYTDLNVDGRFTCVGENLWGLKHWYPFESTEDDILSLDLAEDEELEVDEEEEMILEEDLEEEIVDLGEDEDLDLEDEDELPLDNELDEEEDF